MHISQSNIGRSSQNKTEKGKNKRQFQLKSIFVLIFEFACEIGVYVQEADVLVRERRRTKEFIQVCTKENKNSCVKWNDPTGFQLCYRLYVFERLIT